MSAGEGGHGGNRAELKLREAVALGYAAAA